MRRLALIVEYDGTDFSGSQSQENARTVQSVLEHAASEQLTSGPIRIRMASRTDAGVHATYQVASCETPYNMTAEQIRDSMNSKLPQDVAVREVYFVPSDFDPLRSAVSRCYTYMISVSRVRSTLRYRTELHLRKMPHVETMLQSAQSFVGEHDFASFAAIERNSTARPTVRRIDEVTVAQATCGANQRVTFTVRGKSFLRQQVRRMVGMLLAIGLKKSTPSELLEYMGNPRRGAYSHPLPAHALTLSHIEYPPGTFECQSESDGIEHVGTIPSRHLN